MIYAFQYHQVSTYVAISNTDTSIGTTLNYMHVANMIIRLSITDT